MGEVMKTPSSNLSVEVKGMMGVLRVFEVLGIKNVSPRHVEIIVTNVRRFYPYITIEEFDSVVRRGLNFQLGDSDVEPTFNQVMKWLKKCETEYTYGIRSLIGEEAFTYAINHWWQGREDLMLKVQTENEVQTMGIHMVAPTHIIDSDQEYMFYNLVIKYIEENFEYDMNFNPVIRATYYFSKQVVERLISRGHVTVED